MAPLLDLDVDVGVDDEGLVSGIAAVAGCMRDQWRWRCEETCVLKKASALKTR
jgi:hypothetical protein